VLLSKTRRQNLSRKSATALFRTNQAEAALIGSGPHPTVSQRSPNEYDRVSRQLVDPLSCFRMQPAEHLA